MQFDEADTASFKTWLITRLEDISDADSDVLGDYVLALVKSEEPEEEVRTNCLGALEDFLGDHTQKFVTDVFEALRTKSYMPGYVAPRPVQTPSLGFGAPTDSAVLSSPADQNAAASYGNGGRKRGYNEGQSTEPTDRRDPHYGDRAQKQLRRGNQRGGLHNGRDARPGYDQPMSGGFPGANQYKDMAPIFTPPPGFPPLDPNNPMAAFMAMQAMGLPALPGFPTFPNTGLALGVNSGERRLSSSLIPQKVGERCRDYDTKGFCAAGSMCPYEHGADHIIAPGATEEYDPRQASLSGGFDSSPSQTRPPQPRQFDNNRPLRGGRGGRGNQNGGTGQTPRSRAAFSSAAPNNDRNMMSIVVEQIPEEHFSDEAVRAFFAEFGAIEEVTMQAYKRLAIIRYADYPSARRAYDSPKVVFDNRFVKVYWYKPEGLPTPRTDFTSGSNGAHMKQETEDEVMIDPEAFAIKQAEAQRVHEEKAKKLKQAESQKEELERRIKAQAEERRRLLEKLAKKTGDTGSASAHANGNGNGTTATATTSATATEKRASSAQTEALRAKLAELEAEAETLGLSTQDDQSPYTSSYPAYRGRGGSGPTRGAYIPRGRGSSYPPRGRGRGGASGAWSAFASSGATGAVARLDNRPKTVSVLAANPDVDFDDAGGAAAESLRGFLFGVGEFGEISTGASAAGAGAGAASAVGGGEAEAEAKKGRNRASVRFNERYVAEEFIRRAGKGEGIPGIGRVELAWVANANVLTTMTTTASKLSVGAAAFVPGGAAVSMVKADDVEMGDGDKGGGGGEDREMDYDVADDDDDRWAR